MAASSFSEYIADKKSRDAAVLALRELANSPGWKVLKMYLQSRESMLQEQLNVLDRSRDKNEDWMIKVERHFCEELQSLPEKLITDMTPGERGTKDFDPYE
jgi:hypothetical protein